MQHMMMLHYNNYHRYFLYAAFLLQYMNMHITLNHLHLICILVLIINVLKIKEKNQ